MLPNRSWPAAAGPNGHSLAGPAASRAPHPSWIAGGRGCQDGPAESAFPAGRSRGVTVAVEGFFAFVWFGWGQADAPSWLVIPLAVGTAGGGLASAVAPSTVTGVGAGLCLLAFGVATLLAGGHGHGSPSPQA